MASHRMFKPSVIIIGLVAVVGSIPAALSLPMIRVIAAPNTTAIARAMPAGSHASEQTAAIAKTIEIPFSSHDGYAMFGKLTLPTSNTAHPVVIYVQTAEAGTVDVKRSN